MRAISVLTTVGTEREANLIADELLERRQAACVNIISGVRSVYRWRGSICKDSEFLLIIKTLDAEYELVAETIRELHSYDVPELLAFRTNEGDPDFLDWIASCVDKEAEFEDEAVEDEDADEDED